MKISLSTILCIATISAFGQNDIENQEIDSQDFGKNEININVLYTVFKAVEVNYERFFDEDLSAGLAASYWFGESTDWSYTTMAYGRFYPFSDKANNALFIELNAGVYDSFEESYYINPDPFTPPTFVEGENTVSFGMGFALGAKFYSKKGYTFNFYGGLNRNFVEDQYPESVPRVGINVGKRF